MLATWYCLTGVSRCTAGYRDEPAPSLELFAAVSREWLYLKGHTVLVCVDGNEASQRCVRVTVVDCLCSRSHGIDLYADAFRQLAPLSQGRISVVLRW